MAKLIIVLSDGPFRLKSGNSEGADVLIIIFLRTIIVFIALFVSMRVMGKRQLGELEPSELVIAVLISNMAAIPLQDIGIPIMNGLIPVLTLLCMEFLISSVTMKNVKLRKLICGLPSIVIENGRIIQAEMRKNRLTVDELLEELRSNGYMDMSKIKYAILEASGKLSVILFAEEKPATHSALNLKVEDFEMPKIIISDGRLLRNNLILSGLDEAWLHEELRKRNVKSVKDVFILTVDNGKRTYFTAKERKA